MSFNGAALLRLGSSSGISDATQLEQRILDFVTHMVSVEGIPVSLSNLNRRFGKRAKELGTSAADVCAKLADAKQLRVIAYDKKNILMPEAFVKAQEASFDDVNEYISVQNSMLDRAQ